MKRAHEEFEARNSKDVYDHALPVILTTPPALRTESMIDRMLMEYSDLRFFKGLEDKFLQRE
eukprot:1124258-Prymnesium_polylepis.1